MRIQMSGLQKIDQKHLLIDLVQDYLMSQYLLQTQA